MAVHISICNYVQNICLGREKKKKKNPNKVVTPVNIKPSPGFCFFSFWHSTALLTKVRLGRNFSSYPQDSSCSHISELLNGSVKIQK